MDAKTCARCSRPLWFKGTPPEDRPAGSAIHTGHGLCTTCYARAQRDGSMPRKAPAISRPEHTCDRCGITTTERDLCVDCRDVLMLRCPEHGLLEPCLACATVRNAARDGVTPQEAYDAFVRGGELAGEGVRTCALDGCEATFAFDPANPLRRYCKPAHRAAGHRTRTGGGSS